MEKKRINKISFIDVAFKIGGSTSIKYLVLQVHYANIDKFKCNFQFSNVIFYNLI